VQRFRGGLVFKVHRLCASLNSRLESNKEEEKSTQVIVRLWTRWGATAHLASERGVSHVTDGARNLHVIQVHGLGAHRERKLVPVASRALVVGRGVPRNEDVRLPGTGNPNSHGARPVHPIITMIKVDSDQ